MMRAWQIVGAALIGLWLSGCDAAWQQVSPPPPVASGRARIYVYRAPTVYDSTVWTAVLLNGTVIGVSAPGAAFYRDVAPGTYQVEPRSDNLYPDQAKTIAVKAGQTVFVKVQPVPNWNRTGRQTTGNTFTVAIVDPAIGLYEIGSLRLTRG